MTRLSALRPVPDALRGATIALGNFDGVHLGHQAVIRAAIDDARAAGRPAIVATFDPHPVRHFRPETPPFRLTTLDQREQLFTALGADAMTVFAFDDALANLSHDAFARMLFDDIGAAGVVTGSDFTYGQGRRGNSQMLAEACAREGRQCRAVGAVQMGGEPVSSSRIRAALVAGDPQAAARLLTRPFAVRATVIHGDKRGRTIGYPTANLDLGPYLRPRYGIYAVTGHLPDGRVLKGAANVGVRPSFDPPRELLEPFFFDFAGDLYGQEIEVAFHHFLRPEAKFDTLDALTRQMDADCAKARALLDS